MPSRQTSLLTQEQVEALQPVLEQAHRVQDNQFGAEKDLHLTREQWLRIAYAFERFGRYP